MRHKKNDKSDDLIRREYTVYQNLNLKYTFITFLWRPPAY